MITPSFPRVANLQWTERCDVAQRGEPALVRPPEIGRRCSYEAIVGSRGPARTTGSGALAPIGRTPAELLRLGRSIPLSRVSLHSAAGVGRLFAELADNSRRTSRSAVLARASQRLWRVDFCTGAEVARGTDGGGGGAPTGGSVSRAVQLELLFRSCGAGGNASCASASVDANLWWHCSGSNPATRLEM